MNWTLHKDGLHYDGSETLHHVFVYDAVGRLLHREQIMAGHTTIPMDANGPLFILSHEGNWKSSVIPNEHSVESSGKARYLH
jgi:hypothetical protein